MLAFDDGCNHNYNLIVASFFNCNRYNKKSGIYELKLLQSIIIITTDFFDWNHESTVARFDCNHLASIKCIIIKFNRRVIIL